MLHAVDDRLAAYGFETNTGTKFVAVVDMRGRRVDGRAGHGGGAHGVGGLQGGGIAGGGGAAAAAAASSVGLREGEMKVVSNFSLAFLGWGNMIETGQDFDGKDKGGSGRGDGTETWTGKMVWYGANTKETGLQSDADGVYQVAAEPVLRSGRAFAAYGDRRQEDYEQEVYGGYEEDRGELGTGCDGSLIGLLLLSSPEKGALWLSIWVHG